ncbi:hypothetical protein [Actinomadura sp. 7K534]|uniref:hypothetical protein n=1 Tax=Actinomadura sp. 7K534 TaxID=2530366 RepID=UPI00105324A9|nr:hypothetical protein [Actinomadura sp. 7K534]TDB89488.1 hypothetical protein E1266_29645 [Actinomadura sp. 7K534]
MCFGGAGLQRRPHEGDEVGGVRDDLIDRQRLWATGAYLPLAPHRTEMLLDPLAQAREGMNHTDPDRVVLHRVLAEMEPDHVSRL